MIRQFFFSALSTTIGYISCFNEATQRHYVIELMITNSIGHGSGDDRHHGQAYEDDLIVFFELFPQSNTLLIGRA
jgi:hypothetical protein